MGYTTVGLPERIQKDCGTTRPPASKYYTDGYLGYVDIVYPDEHHRNIRDKSDTYTVEGINADLRHYIPTLARKNRCFARSSDAIKAVLEVFVEAYNKFGRAKPKYLKN